MTEFDFPLSSDDIFAAENMRVPNPRGSAEATRAVMEFPMERFDRLSDDGRKRVLMAARIYEVSLRMLAKAANEAPTVAHYLFGMRRAITNVYYHSDVRLAAAALHTDTKDNPYDFDMEMLDDEVEYGMLVAALTGRTDLLASAVRILDKAVVLPSEPTRQTVNAFKRRRLAYRNHPSKDNFLSLRDAYRNAVQSSGAIGRYERSSTIAARFAFDAFGSHHFLDALGGMAVCAEDALRQRSTLKILPREIGKELTQAKREATWRKTTPPFTDYSYLALP